MAGYGVLALYLLAFVGALWTAVQKGCMLIAYHLARRGRRAGDARPRSPAEWPFVTVQLPVYNDGPVVSRVLKAACAFDYPADRLEVQVLDDSTDGTTATIAQAVAARASEGHRVAHIRRASRAGFKAGALNHGLRSARGSLIAIFDTDYVPPPEFLLRVVPHFENPRVGLVQTRCDYLNRESSWVTRVQATFLDGQTEIEHRVHAASDRLLFQFNGTGGVWRRATIEGCGGWPEHQSAEDLNLSYIAQLAGWRCRYLPDVRTPGELTWSMRDFRRQQGRWSFLCTQSGRFVLPRLWWSGLPIWAKLDASVPLLGRWSSVFVLLLLLLWRPAWSCLEQFPVAEPVIYRLFIAAAMVGNAAVLAYFWTAQAGREQSLAARCLTTGLTVLCGIGLCVAMAASCVTAVIGRSDRMESTPKAANARGGRRSPFPAGSLAEMALAGYLLVSGFQLGLERTGWWLLFLAEGVAGLLIVSVPTLGAWVAGQRRCASAARPGPGGAKGARSHEDALCLSEPVVRPVVEPGDRPALG